MLFLALAQLTYKMDPMYIIPKDRPEPHNDAHVIFLGGALAQLTDKMDPKYIITKCLSTWIFMKLFEFKTSKSSADGGHLGFCYFWL